MLVQNLTKTNVPVTLPLTRAYVNGFEVFYISTEASDKGLADHLTNFIHSRVSFAPALKNAPPQSLANIYVFRNCIKGSGPLGPGLGGRPDTKLQRMHSRRLGRQGRIIV
jgi:hypothetical protein